MVNHESIDKPSRQIKDLEERAEAHIPVNNADVPPDLAYAIVSEEVLARDWLSPEDEEAWREL